MPPLSSNNPFNRPLPSTNPFAKPLAGAEPFASNNPFAQRRPNTNPFAKPAQGHAEGSPLREDAAPPVGHSPVFGSQGQELPPSYAPNDFFAANGEGKAEKALPEKTNPTLPSMQPPTDPHNADTQHAVRGANRAMMQTPDPVKRLGVSLLMGLAVGLGVGAFLSLLGGPALGVMAGIYVGTAVALYYHNKLGKPVAAQSFTPDLERGPSEEGIAATAAAAANTHAEEVDEGDENTTFPPAEAKASPLQERLDRLGESEAEKHQHELDHQQRAQQLAQELNDTSPTTAEKNNNPFTNLAELSAAKERLQQEQQLNHELEHWQQEGKKATV